MREIIVFQNMMDCGAKLPRNAKGSNLEFTLSVYLEFFKFLCSLTIFVDVTRFQYYFESVVFSRIYLCLAVTVFRISTRASPFGLASFPYFYTRSHFPVQTGSDSQKDNLDDLSPFYVYELSIEDLIITEFRQFSA